MRSSASRRSVTSIPEDNVAVTVPLRSRRTVLCQRMSRSMPSFVTTALSTASVSGSSPPAIRSSKTARVRARSRSGTHTSSQLRPMSSPCT
jgi:hypothetical protein